MKVRDGGKILKPKTKWIRPYQDHPSDKLKIRLMMDEKVKGDRIIGLQARIEPGHIHQLHIHESEYVIVYTLKGKCRVTIGTKTKSIGPKTMIFIPPKVPHRFENNTKQPWEGMAFAIGSKKEIKNIWMDE